MVKSKTLRWIGYVAEQVIMLTLMYLAFFKGVKNAFYLVEVLVWLSLAVAILFLATVAVCSDVFTREKGELALTVPAPFRLIFALIYFGVLGWFGHPVLAIATVVDFFCISVSLATLKEMSKQMALIREG